jgi:hypothetical protein
MIRAVDIGARAFTIPSGKRAIVSLAQLLLAQHIRQLFPPC